jgi:hypothetical protein
MQEVLSNLFLSLSNKGKLQLDAHTKGIENGRASQRQDIVQMGQ